MNMRTPKSLLKLAEQVSGTVEILTFSGNGQTNTGFAVVDNNRNELIEIEPVWYSNGDRWKVINHCIENGVRYAKTLRGFKAEIKAGHTGYRFSTGLK